MFPYPISPLGDMNKQNTSKVYLADPRNKPGTLRIKTADGTYTDLPLGHIGQRNPDHKIILMVGAELASTTQVFACWADELGTVVPKQDDIIVIAGDSWRVRFVLDKLFGNKFDCVCTRSVGR